MPVRRRAAVWAIAVGLLWAAPGAAQNVTEPSLKAAFVYNLAKFTEWPADALPAGSPFVACMLGDTPVADALERAVRGRHLSGRPVNVVRVSSDSALQACHLLYLSGVTPGDVRRIVAGLNGAPVLSVVDVDGFALPGGVTRMFFESANVRFDLDHGLAKRSRLQLSSKLLLLASRIIDDTKAGGR